MLNPLKVVSEWEYVKIIRDGECHCCGHTDRTKELYEIDGRRFIYSGESCAMLVELDPTAKYGVRVWTDLFEMMKEGFTEWDVDEYLENTIKHFFVNISNESLKNMKQKTINDWLERLK